jgi:sRNA-binding protein
MSDQLKKLQEQHKLLAKKIETLAKEQAKKREQAKKAKEREQAKKAKEREQAKKAKNAKAKSISKSSTESIGIVTSPHSEWFDKTVYQSSFGKYIKDKDEGRVYLYSNVKIKRF